MPDRFPTQATSPGEVAHRAPSSEAEPEGVLWVKQGDFVRPVQVKVGLSDGISSQVEGRGIEAGTEVVVGSTEIQGDADAMSILPHARSGKK